MHSSPRLLRLCTLLHVERLALASAKTKGLLKNESYVSSGLRETYLRYCVSTRRPYLEVDKTALTITLNTSPLNGLAAPPGSATSAATNKSEEVTSNSTTSTTPATSSAKPVVDEFAFVRTFLDQLNRDIVKSPRHLKLGLQVSSASGMKRQEDRMLPGPKEGSNSTKEKEVELSVSTAAASDSLPPIVKGQGIGSGSGAYTFYTSSKGHAQEICESIFSAYKSMMTRANVNSNPIVGKKKKEALTVLGRRRAVKVRKLKKLMADPTAKLRRRLPFDASTVVF